MVKEQDTDNAKRQGNQGGSECPEKADKIGYSTPYSYCSERLSPFGGLLGLVKFMELIQFKVVFDISRGESSVYNDILAVCGLIGDKSREVVVGSNECIAGAASRRK